MFCISILTTIDLHKTALFCNRVMYSYGVDLVCNPLFIFKFCELKPKFEDHSKNLFQHIITSGEKKSGIHLSKT